jgi:hypothetical protein
VYSISLLYLIDEKQLTKDCKAERLVIGWSEKRLGSCDVWKKKLSHRRSDFPPRKFGGVMGVDFVRTD